MKKIGLVGGLGPASTVEYYLGIIKRSQERFGFGCYPRIVIDSVNMTDHMNALENNDYEALCGCLLQSLNALKSAGSEVAAITANTEHIVWDMACGGFPLPVVSIVDAAVKELRRKNRHRVLVLGTSFTLKSGLYENALKRAGMIPIIPDEEDIALIGGLIFPNLENGIVIPEDKRKLTETAERYIENEKADALLLGCTELPLAIKQEDVSVPVFDTTQIHIDEICRAAFDE